MRRQRMIRDYTDTPARLEARAQTIMADARLAQELVLETKQLLEEATTDFLRMGVAYISNRLSDGLERYLDYNAASCFRAIAKEHGRPPIIAEEAPKLSRSRWAGRAYNTIQLSIPVHNRLKPIAAGLLLASQEADTEDQAARLRVPIARCDSPGTWKIFFNGDEGRKAFTQFIEGCHTNPVLRVVLKL